MTVFFSSLLRSSCPLFLGSFGFLSQRDLGKMVTLVPPAQGTVQGLQWSPSISHHAAVVEGGHLVALELFPLQEPLRRHVPEEIEVPFLLAPSPL